jgi:hypothetical protein
LAGENGPWDNDGVNYYYNNGRQRSGLRLLQPNASPWTQSYSYDSLMRLTGVLSPAGNFVIGYDLVAADRVNSITMPGIVQVNNEFDGFARLNQRSMYGLSALLLQYSYDQNSQRTQEVWTPEDSSGNYNYKDYTYDNIGQLKTVSGHDYAKDYNLNQYVDTPRAHEQFGYALLMKAGRG